MQRKIMPPYKRWNKKKCKTGTSFLSYEYLSLQTVESKLGALRTSFRKEEIKDRSTAIRREERRNID